MDIHLKPKLDEAAIDQYTSERSFKKKKNRTRSWRFKCAECERPMDDDIDMSYWYRDDIGSCFCSRECALKHDKDYYYTTNPPASC